MFNWFKKPPPVHFTKANSESELKVLVKQKVLGKLFLAPLEFGGMDIPNNFVYAPFASIEEKRRIDMDTVLPMIKATTAQYSATPVYKEGSLVPSSIQITVQTPTGGVVTVIKIWD